MKEVIMEPESISNSRLWTGRVLSGIAIIFLLFDGITKLMMIPPVIEGTKRLGYPIELIPVIAIILLICTMLYIIPGTSVFGAILLTGYLGGAVASNFRIESPLFSNTLFPVYFAIIIWGGIFLRDKRIGALIPFRKTDEL
jgi:hypothetical protein